MTSSMGVMPMYFTHSINNRITVICFIPGIQMTRGLRIKVKSN